MKQNLRPYREDTLTVLYNLFMCRPAYVFHQTIFKASPPNTRLKLRIKSQRINVLIAKLCCLVVLPFLFCIKLVKQIFPVMYVSTFIIHHGWQRASVVKQCKYFQFLVVNECSIDYNSALWSHTPIFFGAGQNFPLPDTEPVHRNSLTPTTSSSKGPNENLE